MQALNRNTSKLRALIPNQTLVLRSNALFSSSSFPGSRDFEMERNFRPMNSVRGIEQDGRDTPGGARNFEMERNSRPMNFVRGIMEQDRRNIPGGARDFEMGRNSRSMNFVRGIIEQDGRYIPGSAQFPRYTVEQNPDIVHIKLIRNNAFVTVTDSKGNKKIGASSGCLSEMKGGPKLSRYAADATAEHVGRLARNLGLKSVVMKVKGFTYFKKKKQAIMSWKEGFNSSRGDENPIMYIEDTTRRPHNGCRLPRKRRV